MRLIKKNDLFLLEEIVKKNFSSKYKGSVLGILWTILSPLLMMALFTIIFSTLFGRNINNYSVYFLSGWCVFMFFTSSVSNSMNALRSNRNILQRTPAPKYIFVLGSVISEFLNFIIMLVLLVAIIIITHAPLHWLTIPFAVIPIAALFIMLIGLGLMLSVACVYYTDIQHLWSVLSMMFMYASAIFYPMEIIPEPFRSYMILNPLYWVINQFRCAVYYGTFPQGIFVLNLVLLALIILVFGIIIFKKYESKVAMRL